MQLFCTENPNTTCPDASQPKHYLFIGLNSPNNKTLVWTEADHLKV